MSLIDRIFRRSSPREDAHEERVEIKRNESLGQQVWSRPWDFNRFTRRAFGFRLRTSGLFEEGPESAYFVPRYIRRHLKRVTGDVSRPFTRRQRKQRARINRSFQARAGQAPVTFSVFKRKAANQRRARASRLAGARPIPVPS